MFEREQERDKARGVPQTKRGLGVGVVGLPDKICANVCVNESSDYS